MNRFLIGLGNPGKRYEKTRHNAGFLVLDQIVKSCSASPWEAGSKFESLVCKGVLFGEDVLCLKPTSFMNLSGGPVGAALRFFKGSPSQCLVLSDDLDLPFASVRLRLRGGHGGHNGLRSLIESLGSQDFPRIKIGVGRPPLRENGEPCMDPASWVLAPFTSSELATLETTVFEESLLKIREAWGKPQSST